MKKSIFTKKAPKAVGPYSQAILHGNTLYASGQIPINPKTNEVELSTPKEETRLVMENLKAVLTEAGMDFSNVVKTTIFLTDMAAFTEVNEVYAAYFESAPPARETVQVAGLPKGVQVEISVIAIK
jgi:2-iminobutanoate/2-iminopropanoate deaminase